MVLPLRAAINNLLKNIVLLRESAQQFVPQCEPDALVLQTLGEEASWRENAELVFEPDQGLRVGYRGFYKCGIG